MLDNWHLTGKPSKIHIEMPKNIILPIQIYELCETSSVQTTVYKAKLIYQNNEWKIRDVASCVAKTVYELG